MPLCDQSPPPQSNCWSPFYHHRLAFSLPQLHVNGSVFGFLCSELHLCWGVSIHFSSVCSCSLLRIGVLVWLYHTLCIHLHDLHLGCFSWFWLLGTKLLRSLCTSLLMDLCFHLSWVLQTISRPWGRCVFDHCKKLPVSPGGYTLVRPPGTRELLLHTLTKPDAVFLILTILFGVHCGFNLDFLVANDAKHLFTCLSGICIPFCEVSVFC